MTLALPFTEVSANSIPIMKGRETVLQKMYPNRQDFEQIDKINEKQLIGKRNIRVL